MKQEDLTIFEYRMSKSLKNTDDIINERVNGKYTKGTVRTAEAGYIDFMIYRPSNSNPTDTLPVVFNFHGGGFVLPFYEADGKYCQRLADLSGSAVINMNYAVAPEFKFPIPITSSYEAVVKIVKDAEKYNINANKVVVCGHSAGGTIAAALCILDRDKKNIGFRGQIIDYAPLRQSLSPEDRKAIDPTKAISPSRAAQYINWFFADLNDMDNPLASPAIAELNDLPRALVISAEYDSLSAEEELFAARLKESGNDVVYKKFLGCQHGFTHQEFNEYDNESSDKAWKLMAEFINECTL